MISCPVELDGKLPRSVSLTLNRCDNAENNLQIIDNQPPDGVKKEFGVCVKQLTYPNRDFIIRFIEWLHLLRILGAEKVHFYNRFVHQEMMKVIEYFEAKGLVEMKPFLEPSDLSNQYLTSFPTKILENAVVNDCFYRTKNLYKYIAVFDPDEVIMPLNESHKSWHDLIQSVGSSQDIYTNRMIFYPNLEEPAIDGIPKFLYILQHVKVRKQLFVTF